MLKINGYLAEITINGEIVFEGSMYVTDVPIDFLKAFYDYFNNDGDFERGTSSVMVDSEGCEAFFVFNKMSSRKVMMFIETGAGISTKMFEVSPYCLAVELIEDIENNLQEWVDWISFSKGKESKQQQLIYWLEKLKNVMQGKKISEKHKNESNVTNSFIENETKNDEISANNQKNEEQAPFEKGKEVAIKGFTFINAVDTSRLDLIRNYIWSLNFKKKLPVQIAYYDNIKEIEAKQKKARYLISVRPDTQIEDIKQLLLKKKYIQIEENEEQ